MNAQDLQRFKVGLLDDIPELATDPVADPEPIKHKIESFFQQLEE